MNVCFTSTFEGTFDDFKNVMSKSITEFPGTMTEHEQSKKIQNERKWKIEFFLSM